MRGWLWIGLAAGCIVPALALRFSGTHLDSISTALIFGLGIVGGAFLLSWASEVAELDIPRSLAISLLAIIAVLPEYAIDVYLAWSAATIPENVSLATANMTGANRLLIGIGWSLVVILFWARTRQKTVELSSSHSTSLAILALATVYSFTIIIKGYLHIADSVILGLLFCLYIWMNFKGKVEEPELVGPSALIGALTTAKRRSITVIMFLYAAAGILLSAEPFVEGLKGTGESLGLSEFLLIQWIAPLASEAPEILLAAIFVVRGRQSDGLGILVSSKVNQWTLLVATLPAAYSISTGSLNGLPLDARQTTEVLLTSAQSLFAVAILLDFRLSVREAVVLLVLFTSQLFFGLQEARLAFSGLYLFLAFILMATHRDRIAAVPRLLVASLNPGKSGGDAG